MHDVDGNLASTQLSVLHGTLAVTAGGASITGNNSATLTLSGTEAQINATLATLSYQGGLNFNGSDTLTVLSTDSSASTDTDTVNIRSIRSMTRRRLQIRLSIRARRKDSVHISASGKHIQ